MISQALTHPVLAASCSEESTSGSLTSGNCSTVVEPWLKTQCCDIAGKATDASLVASTTTTWSPRAVSHNTHKKP
eukprot:6461635-Amphidinium_carterae.1